MGGAGGRGEGEEWGGKGFNGRGREGGEREAWCAEGGRKGERGQRERERGRNITKIHYI